MAAIWYVLNIGQNTCSDRNIPIQRVVRIILLLDVFVWRMAMRNIWQKANEGK